MRKVLFLFVAVTAALAVAAPALAQPAQIVYRDPLTGALRGARLPDLQELQRLCGLTPPADVEFASVALLASGGFEQAVAQYISPRTGQVYMYAGPGPVLPGESWCLVPDEVLDALEEARSLPANRGPWIALLGALGTLTMVILFTAVWGGGVGPMPELEYYPDAHGPAHPEAPPPAAASAGEPGDGLEVSSPPPEGSV